MDKRFTDKFVELDNVRIVDKGPDDGWDVQKWISSTDNPSDSLDAGSWRTIFHSNKPYKLIEYLHKTKENLWNQKG